MKLLVGLGNPDEKYKNTYHNLGFMCVDKVAEKLGVQFSKEKCKAKIAETKIGREKVILAKPLTYMNLSGESVRELLSFYKIALCDLIVFYDDYDLPKGTIRIREKGSAGTHNGMRNIIELCGSDFPRVRLGFNQGGTEKIPLIDYVLSALKQDEIERFSKVIEIAGKCGVDFASGKPIQEIMQTYNKRTGE